MNTVQVEEVDDILMDVGSEDDVPPLYLLSKEKNGEKIYQICPADHEKRPIEVVKNVLTNFLIQKNKFPIYLYLEVYPDLMDEFKQENINFEVVHLEDFKKRDYEGERFVGFYQVLRIKIDNESVLRHVINRTYNLATINFLYQLSYDKHLDFKVYKSPVDAVVPIYHMLESSSYIIAGYDGLYLELITNEPEFMGLNQLAKFLSTIVNVR
ncbi:hypothetical protein CLV36_10712 [Laceyella sediminis]|uniref:Uncharacterized protein n=1 Tax=Laceyella sediminis TaxID=573074 RepID=A0ABX5EMY8_9BACL|nr:hypothetical protein [Laceyella sediminis]PRZ13822.1 hypothetical protein CLV36_10712 [Laceyella sediminis]